MTIASEITDLQTNLTNAKTAVTSKGGTVGDTGFAGLASEIDTIPSGGTLDNYGSITYLDTNDEEQTLTLIDENYYMELTLITGGGANLQFGDLTLNINKIIEVTIADGVQYIPDNFMNNCANLVTVNLPSSIKYIGDLVFNRCNVTSTINLENVIYIGEYFLYRSINFNQPINLPKIDCIGNYFLASCSNFNSTLTLPASMYKIGNYFLSGCTAFAQTLTLPTLQTISGIANPGTYFMQNCNHFTGPLVCNCPNGTSSDTYTLSTTDSTALMYTTGVTLTGTYASDWKTAFPDRAGSPYRKLIVGS